MGPESERAPLSGAVRPVIRSWASRTRTPICQRIRAEFSATSALLCGTATNLPPDGDQRRLRPLGASAGAGRFHCCLGPARTTCRSSKARVRGAAARPLRDRLPSPGCLFVSPGSRADPVWDRSLATAFALLFQERPRREMAAVMDCPRSALPGVWITGDRCGPPPTSLTLL
jgi:hypothetical protein